MLSLKKKQKKATNQSMKGMPEVFLPAVITITRVGPRTLDDDNLAISCKYVRDTIAARIGVDDGSYLYTWQYRQRKGDYRVEVEINDEN